MLFQYRLRLTNRFEFSVLFPYFCSVLPLFGGSAARGAWRLRVAIGGMGVELGPAHDLTTHIPTVL